MTTELASILQACQAIDPGAGSLVGEIWNDAAPEDALAELEASYQREIAHLPAVDQGAARQYLSGLITRKSAYSRAGWSGWRNERRRRRC